MDGILPLWKEQGMTSHDCVFKLRKIVGTKKIGHAGTLDPDVDGVLPIAIGRATKVIEYMQESGKMYEGEIVLGFSTTTEDASGDIVEKTSISSNISVEEIDSAMNNMIGEITQTPPMYSAVKVNGKRLYEYARAGEVVERPTRKASIHLFDRMSDPVYDKENQIVSWKFRVSCGKGTYVRTLAVDTGKSLGFPAHMSRLTRTESGGFRKDEAISLTEVQEAVSQNKISEFLFPLESALENFDVYKLSSQEWKSVKNGVLFPASHFKDVSWPVVFQYNEKAVALYNYHPKKENIVKPVKVFRNEV